MVVKIQRPLATFGGEPQFLVYNQGKDIQTMIPLDDGIGKDILKHFFQETDAPKVYVDAEITKMGILVMNSLSEDQAPGW
jgi:hypothetical protein